MIATSDPDPRVNGQGIQKLREKGIEVITGICESEARAINSGFVHKVKEKLPLVSLKIASSADGKIATSTGESKWITSREARNFGHLIRSKHDCIITGIGTVIKDNPLLTCRLKGLENKSPVRVIIDTELKIPLKCKLVESARKVPLWVFAADDVVASVKNLAALQAKMNIRLFGVKRAASGIDITTVLKTLAAEGITRAMVEAGPILSSTFIKEKLVDNIYWFRSSSVIGGDASPAIRPLDILSLTDSLRFHRKCIRNLGQDILEEFTCSPE